LLLLLRPSCCCLPGLEGLQADTQLALHICMTGHLGHTSLT
jgi:hypothetical protein